MAGGLKAVLAAREEQERGSSRCGQLELELELEMELELELETVTVTWRLDTGPGRWLATTRISTETPGRAGELRVACRVTSIPDCKMYYLAWRKLGMDNRQVLPETIAMSMAQRRGRGQVQTSLH